MTEVVALVPMRHHSERVPGKNYRPLAGRPLYEYILDTLHEVPEVSQIVVDTDSSTLRDGIASSYPQVVLIDRPQEIRDGDIPMNAVLLHDVRQVEAPMYLQTHSTNPFLRSETISAAIRDFAGTYPMHDSLFAVTKLQVRLWDNLGAPLNHDPAELLRTQDLAPVYIENSSLYLFDRAGFLERRNRIGTNPKMFEIPFGEALDIDDEDTFRLAEDLVSARGRA